MVGSTVFCVKPVCILMDGIVSYNLRLMILWMDNEKFVCLSLLDGNKLTGLNEKYFCFYYDHIQSAKPPGY